MMRGSWHPPMHGRDLAMVVMTHIMTTVVLAAPVVLVVDRADWGFVASNVVKVPLTLLAVWLGYRVAGRVASWRVQLRLMRALRREP